MAVHFVQDPGYESALKPFAPVEAVCGRALTEAHEIVRPESDAEVCPDCLSWSKRNRYQNQRCAVEMSATAAASRGGKE
jgi:ribosome-binding protein aMBF1 (putative translation factor)